MRFFLQNQRYAATQDQEANFNAFGKQARNYLDTAGDLFITPISLNWDLLEQKGSRYGAFLVTKTLVRGGKRFSALPSFFDPSRLTPVMISVPTGSNMSNMWLFVGSQVSFQKSD